MIFFMISLVLLKRNGLQNSLAIHTAHQHKTQVSGKSLEIQEVSGRDGISNFLQLLFFRDS